MCIRDRISSSSSGGSGGENSRDPLPSTFAGSKGMAPMTPGKAPPSLSQIAEVYFRTNNANNEASYPLQPKPQSPPPKAAGSTDEVHIRPRRTVSLATPYVMTHGRVGLLFCNLIDGRIAGSAKAPPPRLGFTNRKNQLDDLSLIHI